MKIELNLDCDYNKTPPICVFGSKHNSREQTLHKTNNVVLNFDIESEDFLTIGFINKDDADDNVVFIKKILVDSIDLQHFLLKGRFTPEYNMNWFNKQDPKPPLVYAPCTELRHGGVWEIKLTTPIWKMIMEEWLNDKK
jgi:hypothetical protein|tara:strand:- start:1277 stop:1693 length:417 start_codon:yes stop_codon:yes gene_type:complete